MEGRVALSENALESLLARLLVGNGNFAQGRLRISMVIDQSKELEARHELALHSAGLPGKDALVDPVRDTLSEGIEDVLKRSEGEIYRDLSLIRFAHSRFP